MKACVGLCHTIVMATAPKASASDTTWLLMLLLAYLMATTEEAVPFNPSLTVLEIVVEYVQWYLMYHSTSSTTIAYGNC